MIGYVLSGFPKLSTTFILDELLGLEAQGVPLQVFSLARPTESLRHAEVAELRSPVHQVAERGMLLRLLRAQRQCARANPVGYRRALSGVARQGSPELLWRFFQAGYVAAEARRLGIRHLHAHFAHHPATVAMLAAELAGISYSFTAHAMDLFRRQVDRGMLARKLGGARFVVTVSEFHVRFLRELAPEAGAKIQLIHYGIDLDRFTPVPRTSPPARIVCVARLVEKKGIATLIEACRLLRARGLELECEILGEGPLRDRLERQIRSGGLDEVVHLRGAATWAQVRAAYRDAQLFVLPCIVAADGDRDGLPVALLEALATGLPVISTPVTGIPEAVRDGHNGLLVPSGDAVALADAVARLWSDPELYRHLAANARPAVAASFDRRSTIATLRALLLETPIAAPVAARVVPTASPEQRR